MNTQVKRHPLIERLWNCREDFDSKVGDFDVLVLTGDLVDEIERLRKELERVSNDRNNQLDRLRAAAGHVERLRARVAELEAAKKTCRWHETNTDEYPGVYTTGCGHMFEFIEDGIKKNGAVYCQYCGGKIVEAAR